MLRRITLNGLLLGRQAPVLANVVPAFRRTYIAPPPNVSWHRLRHQFQGEKLLVGLKENDVMLVHQAVDWGDSKALRKCEDFLLEKEVNMINRVKNTVVRRSFMGTPYEGLIAAFQSANGVIFIEKEADLLPIMQALDKAKVTVIAGSINDYIIHHNDLNQLLAYTDPLQPLSTLVSLLSSPTSGLIRALDSPTNSLIRTLAFMGKDPAEATSKEADKQPE